MGIKVYSSPLWSLRRLSRGVFFSPFRCILLPGRSLVLPLDVYPSPSNVYFSPLYKFKMLITCILQNG